MPANDFEVKATSSASATDYLEVIAATVENGVITYDGIVSAGGSVSIYYNSSGLNDYAAKMSRKVMTGDKAYIFYNVQPGYRFVGWYETVNESGYSDFYDDKVMSQSEPMPASETSGQVMLRYYAVFEKEYQLLITADTGFLNYGTSGNYIQGEDVSINATLLPERVWSGWSVVSGIAPEGLTVGPTGEQEQTIKMSASNVVLKAQSNLFFYGLTVQTRYTDNGTFLNNGGGTVKIDAGATGVKQSLQIELNSSVIITAKASIGYRFLGWFKTVTDTDFYDPLSIQNPADDPIIKTEPMSKGEYIGQEDVLVYYAIFAKEYIYKFTADDGVQSQSPVGANNFYYGQEIDISATVKPEFDWAEWKMVSGIAPSSIIYSEQSQKIVIGAGNCTLKAITTATTLSSYSLTTFAKYTDAADNNTLILGASNGTFSAPVQIVKYNSTTTLTAEAFQGFVLYGIYKYNINSIQGNMPWKTAAECSVNGNIYTISSEPMQEEGLIYYAVFQRAEYVVTTDKAEGSDITIDGLNNNKAYFGQRLNYNASVEAGYEKLSVKVYKTGTSDIVAKVSTYYLMPFYDITFVVSASPILYEIIYDANSGSFPLTEYSGAVNSNGEIIGGVYYQTQNFIYYIDENKIISQSGAPIPYMVGYKIVRWNTQPDGNGSDFITYNQSGTPTYEEWNQASGQRLYAIYELADFNYTLTQHTSEFVYDGLKHNVLTININNFIANQTYSYTWYNEMDEIVSQTIGEIPYSTLQLRSVNQSGLYYCEINIVGEDVAERTMNTSINITKQTLNLGFVNVVGDYAISFSPIDLTGLVAGHMFFSGHSFFKSGKENITYNEANKNLIETELILQTLSVDYGALVTKEDGADLIDNYEITYTGQVFIESPFNSVHLMTGLYERTINEQTYEDVLSDNVMTNVNFEMTYESDFESTTFTINGVQNNYIKKTDLPGDLTININNAPENYKLYKIFINNTEIFNADIIFNEDGKIQIILHITAGLMLDDENEFSYLDIRFYLTNQALVVYNYGFESIEISGGYVTYDGINERILELGSNFVVPTEPTRIGFNFIGWYYDNNFELQVGNIWLKAGQSTVYAKWELIPIILDNLNLLVYDNEVLTDAYSRDYNGNIIRLGYNLDIFNPVINYKVFWYKYTGGEYKIISNPNIRNVADSGQYSFSLNATYNSMLSHFALGQLSVQITITKANVSLTAEISKTYDSTTNLSNIYFVNGVNGEFLKLTGKYVSANVNIISETISPVEIINLGLESYDGAMAGNYTLITTEYFGKFILCL